MKILIISTLNLCHSNGGTVHFTSISQEFRRAGHILDAIIPSTNNQDIDHQIATKYFDKVIFSSNTLSQLIPISKTSINSLLQIFTILQQSPDNYDWVYLRSNLLSFFVLLALKLRGFKKIATEHNGWFVDELTMMGVSSWQQNIIKYLQIRDGKLANLVRTVVPNIKQKLLENGIDSQKIFVAGNGTDINFFQPKNRQEILKKLNLNPEYFYLGFIGDLEPWQGVEVAINAMSTIYDKYPETRLLVIGGGRQLHYLKETYSHLEYIKLMGAVPYQESNDYINCFDIALLPKQGLDDIGYSPIKLYAYAAAGRAILASDIKGIKELEPNKFLVLHQPGNSQDLAAKAIEMIYNPEKLAHMGKTAREYAEKHFSWKLVTDQIIQVMDNYDLQEQLGNE
jgi:glycosyltransferase involved in cell wall biosynthesis